MHNSFDLNEINIYVQRIFNKCVKRTYIKYVTKFVLNSQQITKVTLSINIIDAERIKILNSRYRNLEESTDVLSFPSSVIDPITNNEIIGDIFLSVPNIAENAASNGITFIEEFTLVLIHGILHLLGYDHKDEAEEKIMWGLQSNLFKNFLDSTPTT